MILSGSEKLKLFPGFFCCCGLCAIKKHQKCESWGVERFKYMYLPYSGYVF